MSLSPLVRFSAWLADLCNKLAANDHPGRRREQTIFATRSIFLKPPTPHLLSASHPPVPPPPNPNTSPLHPTSSQLPIPQFHHHPTLTPAPYTPPPLSFPSPAPPPSNPNTSPRHPTSSQLPIPSSTTIQP
ncbi:classical arabinogalactan protein 4-like [Haliotis rufescens]|uniref:classical arabinogalactan protein 4-like n=1 Tax=Haliotis rufescens TaxID=6454 RepID=UPI00201EB2CF|nr:classical arabinogalactan protein 4-like [Haliotis rufescens]